MQFVDRLEPPARTSTWADGAKLDKTIRVDIPRVTVETCLMEALHGTQVPWPWDFLYLLSPQGYLGD